MPREPSRRTRGSRGATPKSAPRAAKPASRSAKLTKISNPTIPNPLGTAGITEVRRQEALLKTGALQNAIFNSANFSSIATDAKGVIQIFNVGAERMLGYTAAEVVNKITPADISDPQEVIARAKASASSCNADYAGLRGPGVQGLARHRGHLRVTYIRKEAAASRRWSRSRPYATSRTPSSAIC